MAFATLVTGESANPQLTKDLIKSSNKTITNTDYYDVQLTNLKVNKDYVVQLRWAYDDGTFGDYSTTYSLKTTEEDEPAIPSIPTLVAGDGFFTVKWDGKDSSGNYISNIEKVAVYVSGGSFDSTIESASFTASGTRNITAPIGSYTVTFKSVRVSKVISNASASASVSVTLDVASAKSRADSAYLRADSAIDGLSAKLTKSAKTITDVSNNLTAINSNGIALFATGTSGEEPKDNLGNLKVPTSGARMVMNYKGLVGYNSSSTNDTTGITFSIDAAGGSAYFSGNIEASNIIGNGLTAGTGNTKIRISSLGPTINVGDNEYSSGLIEFDSGEEYANGSIYGDNESLLIFSPGLLVPGADTDFSAIYLKGGTELSSSEITLSSGTKELSLGSDGLSYTGSIVSAPSSDNGIRQISVQNGGTTDNNIGSDGDIILIY